DRAGWLARNGDRIVYFGRCTEERRFELRRHGHALPERRLFDRLIVVCCAKAPATGWRPEVQGLRHKALALARELGRHRLGALRDERFEMGWRRAEAARPAETGLLASSSNGLRLVRPNLLGRFVDRLSILVELFLGEDGRGEILHEFLVLVAHFFDGK